jgi:branched-chain amino acid transport system permease protein
MLQQTVNTLTNAAVYALFAMGYALVFGVLDILNLAHAAIFMLGAFAAIEAVTTWHWPLVAALPFGMLVGGLLGVVLDLVAVEPLRARGAGFLSPLISTIAASIIFENIAFGAFGPDTYSFPLGTFPEGSITIGSAVIQPVQILIVALAVALMVGLTLLLRFTRLGRAIRAVAANPMAAEILGIDVRQTIAITFFIASALGALAGICYGLYLRDAISWNVGANVQLRGLSIIVLGGMDSIPGVWLGALVLAAGETIGVVQGGSAYRDAIAFGLLFVILLVRPSGILGRRGLRAA